jgi:TPR repeat protein
VLGCVAQNDSHAIQLFETALTMDPPSLPVALTNSGIMHSISSLPQNYSRARFFWLKSAAQGDVPGQYWLGRDDSSNLTAFSRAALLQVATRYHALRHVCSAASRAALKESSRAAAARLFLLAGFLGVAEAFADAAFLLNDNSSLRFVREAWKGHHPGADAMQSRAEFGAELLRRDALSDDEFFDLAVAAANLVCEKQNELWCFSMFFLKKGKQRSFLLLWLVF